MDIWIWSAFISPHFPAMQRWLHTFLSCCSAHVNGHKHAFLWVTVLKMWRVQGQAHAITFLISSRANFLILISTWLSYEPVLWNPSASVPNPCRIWPHGCTELATVGCQGVWSPNSPQRRAIAMMVEGCSSPGTEIPLSAFTLFVCPFCSFIGQ